MAPEKNRQADLLDTAHLDSWRELAGDELPSFLSSLMADFESNYRDLRAELSLACKQEDCVELARITHRLAGSLGNLGLRQAAVVCREAEREARQGAFSRFGEFAAEIDRCVATGLEALRQFCA